MSFYALVTVPLIQKLTAPVWYADDAAACSKSVHGGIKSLL